MIDWKAIGREHFESVVHILITHEWSKAEARAKVSPLDGRGGDDGIDVEVRLDDGLVVYQLKYFVDGMSGGFKDRRRQVVRSWNSVKDREDLLEWVLVMPSVLTPQEYAFVYGLDNPRGIPIKVWARADIDTRLASNPDIARYAERTEPFLEDARIMNQEQAQLLDPIRGLSERVSKLGQRAFEVDPHWDLDFAREGDQTTISLRPKSSESYTESPITVSARFSLERDGDTFAQIDKVLGFGLDESVRIEEGLEEITLDGPSFLPQPSETASMTMQQITRVPDELSRKPVSLVFTDADGARIGTHVGITDHIAKGHSGFIWRVFCYRAIRITFYGALNPGVELPPAEVKFDIGGASASSFRDALQLLLDIHRAEKISLVLSGNTIGTWTNVGLRFGSVQDLQELAGFADDLIAIEALAKTKFVLPAEVVPNDVVLARMVRALLEGVATAAPMIPGFTQVIPIVAAAQFETSEIVPRGDIHVSSPEFGVNLLGVEIPIGHVELWHPLVRTEVSSIPGNEQERLLTMSSPEGQCFIFTPGPWTKDMTTPVDIVWPIPNEPQPAWLADLCRIPNVTRGATGLSDLDA